MANPTRPATGQVIDTAWGLAVADTVVRTYPNAASRTTDLAGISSAELLGQFTVLTDTGRLEQYAGPVLGWQRPWSAPWGYIAYKEGVGDIHAAGGIDDVLSITPVPQWPAGRLIRMDSVVHAYVASPTVTACAVFHYFDSASSSIGRHSHAVAWDGSHREGFVSWNQYATTGITAARMSVAFQGVDPAWVGSPNSSHPHRLLVTDLGPAVNPTALVLADDGTITVDQELVDPEYAHLWVPRPADDDTDPEPLEPVK